MVSFRFAAFAAFNAADRRDPQRCNFGFLDFLLFSKMTVTLECASKLRNKSTLPNHVATFRKSRKDFSSCKMLNREEFYNGVLKFEKSMINVEDWRCDVEVLHLWASNLDLLIFFFCHVEQFAFNIKFFLEE
ncbi:hypothetical protein ACFE04_020611 [Oxalis oulophora]